MTEIARLLRGVTCGRLAIHWTLIAGHSWRKDERQQCLPEQLMLSWFLFNDLRVCSQQSPIPKQNRKVDATIENPELPAGGQRARNAESSP